jgi:hypothetical protein
MTAAQKLACVTRITDVVFERGEPFPAVIVIDDTTGAKARNAGGTAVLHFKTIEAFEIAARKNNDASAPAMVRQAAAHHPSAIYVYWMDDEGHGVYVQLLKNVPVN